MGNVRLLKFDANYGYAEELALNDTAYLGKVALAGIGGVAIDGGGNLISNVADPVNQQDVVTLAWAQKLRMGIDSIDSCRALANTNIANLSGTMTIDGVPLVAGDRVLLIAQSDPKQNGVWQVQTGAWTRPADFAAGLPASGKHTFIESGDNVFGGNGYLCNTQKGSDTVDTNALTWIQFGGLGEVTAGAGLQKSTVNGNTISILLATNSGLTFTSGGLDHLLNAAGGLNKTAAGVGITVNTNNTAAVDSNGLRVIGVPTNFTVGGTAVDSNVTATNLNALVDGNASLADALHNHLNVKQAQSTVDTHTNGSTALAIGDPVQWGSGGTLSRCDAANLSTAQCIGVALTACPANGTVAVAKLGIAPNVLTQTTPGTPVYLAVGGGLTTSLAVGVAQSIVRLGTASPNNGLDLHPTYIGQRAAT